MPKDRKARKATENIDFSKPIDLSIIGTEDDPCFGKLYNLTANECKRCGDSELCGVVFSQEMTKSRRKIAKKKRFKDIELEDDSLSRWVAVKKKEGLKRFKIIKLAKKTFGSTSKQIKKLYEEA